MAQIEVVKKTIPQHLLDRIESSLESNLELTCGELVSYVLNDATCAKAVRELTDPQNTSDKDWEKAENFGIQGENAAKAAKAAKAANAGDAANTDYHQALWLYTQAIRYVPFGALYKDFLEILYSNRAVASHDLGLFTAAQTDFTRAIHLQPERRERWHNRGLIRAKLKMWDKAVEDLNEALRLCKSVSEREETRTQLHIVQALKSAWRGGVESDTSKKADRELWPPGRARCETGVVPLRDPEDQWGMYAQESFQAGKKIHEEEPVAAVLVKEYQDTRCHFCFEPLPVNPVPCLKCAMPMYCDEKCLSAACDQKGPHHGEHMHECGKGIWSTALPTDVVLAARLFSRSRDNAEMGEKLYEYCHHYNNLHSSKVDMLVKATVVALCIRGVENFELTPANIAKLARLLAIVRENAMDINTLYLPREPQFSGMKVSIGLGVYAFGRTYNHSCKPNIHASFRYRRLKVYTIVDVNAGTQLKLSYGAAQVGDMRREERQAFLQDRYSFTCTCPSCKEVTQPELLFALCCTGKDCKGVVPGPSLLQYPDQHSATDIGTSERNVLEPGVCVLCGTAIDLQLTTASAKKVMEDLDNFNSIRLRQSQQFLPTDSNLLDDAFDLLRRCQQIFHASSKEVAKAEYVVAKAHFITGQRSLGIALFKTSIAKLVKIYGEDHVVVAFERWKLYLWVKAAGGRETEAEGILPMANNVLSTHYGVDWLESVELFWPQHTTSR